MFKGNILHAIASLFGISYRKSTGLIRKWVMHCFAAPELRNGSLVALPLGRRKARRDWGALHWRTRRLTLAEETFLGLCRTASEDLFQAETVPA